MNSSVDFAILAPVPDEHLRDGIHVVANEGYVAYGSRKWELFGEIDALRVDQPVPVLIYPSSEDEAGKLAYLIKWTGWYVGHVRSELGAYPNGTKYRPVSTEKYEGDRIGYWAIYWHVAELQNLPDHDWKPISSLQSYKHGKYWKSGHAPRGPEVVGRPAWI